MSDQAYVPPEIWTWEQGSGGKFANINRPIAGATFEGALPVGRHDLQLYSLATPNGAKVTILLEELIEAGHPVEYDAWPVDILKGEQFSSGFVAANPNSKIPALVDRSGPEPLQIFESGAILMHLAERFGAFMPTGPAERAAALSWLFWQVGSGPYLGGGFGHFYAYAPVKLQYPIDRFAMETKRQLDVLDRHLAEHAHLAGEAYTIADMAVLPWYGALLRGELYGAGTFLQVQEYKHLRRWTDQLWARPAVQRGLMVNRAWGDPAGQLRERHERGDFETGTWDKVGPKGG